jgi:hypothetical protein
MSTLLRRVAPSVLVVGVLAVGSGLLASPVAEPKGFVAGFVRDPAGVPVPSIWIAREGFRDRIGGVHWARSDIEGRFRFEGLPDGKVVLRVTGAIADVRTGVLVETTAGTKELAVVVEPGPQVLARIAGYQPPAGPDRYARLVTPGATDYHSARYAPVSRDGRVRFVQLEKDAPYELWVGAGNGRTVRAGGLLPSDREVSLEPQPGKTITGRVLVGKRHRVERARVTAYAYPGFEVGRATPASDGTFAIQDLPEGTYTVSAGFHAGEVLDSSPVTVAAGAKDLVLEISR